MAAASKRYDLGARVIAPLTIGERRVFIRSGEGPKLEDQKPTPPPAPSAPPAQKPTVPDEDKFE